MASRPTRICLALALLAVLAAAGCFNAQTDAIDDNVDLAGGGGMETTEGNLASLAGAPTGARVSLIPVGFNALRDTLADSMTVLTDSNGVYQFRGLVPGRYNLEAHLPSAGTRCFRPGVVIAKGDRTIAGTDTLTAPGRLRLSWEGSRRGVLTQNGRLFRLELTGKKADSGGITLDSLPAGQLPPFTFTDLVDSASYLWTDSVRIAPGMLDSVPIREDSVPIPNDSVPIPNDSVPIPNDSVPIPNDSVPIPNDSVPIPMTRSRSPMTQSPSLRNGHIRQS